jgi:CRISPR-associated protein Cas1
VFFAEFMGGAHNMANLATIPRFSDRWSHIYLEHGRLEKEADALAFFTKEGSLDIPIKQIGVVLIGPGTSVTHEAVKHLAENNTLVCWTGEQGVRLYAHSTGGTHSARRMLLQAALYSDMNSRIEVIRRMYGKRFSEPLPDDVSLEQIRGMEGFRVRKAYEQIAQKVGVEWTGRNYDQSRWGHADSLNRALSAANSCLYGVCHAAILSAGYSPAIGFIHTGKMLSFVYDIADLYKTEIVVPIAFGVVKESDRDVERRVRIQCRDAFHNARLLNRILPDISEVLNVGDDVGESAEESEGRIITLADRAANRSLPWESERPSA